MFSFASSPDDRAAHAEYLERSRFVALDGLRALSIVPVVWHHANPVAPEGFLGKGAAGVALFFAISGFLITTLLLRERRRRASGHIDLVDFYRRRARRIFPLYYVVLAGHAAWALAIASSSPVARHFLAALPWHATYTANWFVDYAVPHPVMFTFGWSLCVEEQFYLAWPPVLRFVRGRSLPALAMIAAIGLDFAVEHRRLGLAWPPDAVRIVSSFAAPIGLGALVALALDHPLGHRAARAVCGRAAAAPLALAAVVGLLAADGVPLLAFDAALALLVATLVVSPRSGLDRLLGHAAALHVGLVSYGIYLLHVPALGVVRAGIGACVDKPPPPWMVFAFGLPLAIGAATLAHRYVERPFLRRSGRAT
jgi:peptidoglycan/LPS O-acetylase OafA/YrhL